ncbi:MAG: multidrug effflux MFS transporter [Bdellovibrionota bacterium]
MQKTKKPLLILILGCMTALSPFSIDMYLPAFQTIASDFNTTVAAISLSLSSYFIGLSGGQLFYGPLLDRFGRKKPLYVGLAIYILASLLCLVAKTTEGLIAWRFVQAIGGCAAGVASMAMVRDLFTMKESAKVYSLLILILGASPLLAPTIGGYLSTAFGWHSVFIVLAGMGVLLTLAIRFLLSESHQPDPTVSLKFKPIFKNYLAIIKNAQFYTYVFASSIAFSGLFVYLAGSTVIFLEHYAVNAQQYGWIFAAIAAGIIGSSQFNVLFLRRFSNEQLMLYGLCSQVLVITVFYLGTKLGIFNLVGTVAMFFLFMCCFGVISPNAGALALAPFSKNAGSASALMGFLQMGCGALASASIGILSLNQISQIVGIIACSSTIALVILIFGRREIKRQIQTNTLAGEPII